MSIATFVTAKQVKLDFLIFKRFLSYVFSFPWVVYLLFPIICRHQLEEALSFRVAKAHEVRETEKVSH